MSCFGTANTKAVRSVDYLRHIDQGGGAFVNGGQHPLFSYSGTGLSGSLSVVNKPRICSSSNKRRRSAFVSRRLLVVCTLDETRDDNSRIVPSPSGENSANKLSDEGKSLEDQYAEFADALRLEPQDDQPAVSEKKEVQQAVPTKTTISPSDYKAFEDLLRHNGGMGQKPVKGSKRYISSTQELRQFNSKARGSGRKEREHEDMTVVRKPEFQSSPDIRKESPVEAESRLSDDEIAKGYETMMNEFGTSIHEKTPRTRSINEPEKVSQKLPELLRPPSRSHEVTDTSDVNQSENGFATRKSIDELPGSSVAADTVELQTLNPKPNRPVTGTETEISEPAVPSLQETSAVLSDDSPDEPEPIQVLLPRPQPGEDMSISLETKERPSDVVSRPVDDDIRVSQDLPSGNSEVSAEGHNHIEQLPKPKWSGSDTHKGDRERDSKELTDNEHADSGDTAHLQPRPVAQRSGLRARGERPSRAASRGPFLEKSDARARRWGQKSKVLSSPKLLYTRT